MSAYWLKHGTIGSCDTKKQDHKYLQGTYTLAPLANVMSKHNAKLMAIT
jgi:hypothetical protein